MDVFNPWVMGHSSVPFPLRENSLVPQAARTRSTSSVALVMHFVVPLDFVCMDRRGVLGKTHYSPTSCHCASSGEPRFTTYRSNGTFQMQQTILNMHQAVVCWELGWGNIVTHTLDIYSSPWTLTGPQGKVNFQTVFSRGYINDSK